MDGRPLHPDDLARHGEFLRRLALSMVRGDQHAAEDALQSTYLTALRRGPSTGSVRGWLSRVLASRVADERRGVQTRREQALGPEHDLGHTEERRELTDEVVDAVRALSDEQRTVVYLRYFDDLPPREIAARLGCPLKTVKSRLHRALEALRDRVSERSGKKREQWGALLLPVGVSINPWLGGLLMAKKLTLAAAVVLLFLGTWKVSEWLRAPGPDVQAEVALASSETLDAIPRDDLMSTETAGRELREAGATLAPLAPTANENVATTGSLVIHTVWRDGTTAPGIGVILTSTNDPRVDFDTVRLRSNEAGIVRVPDLTPGPFWLSADRGGYTRAEVVLGEASEVQLTITGNLQVDGIVVDPAGTPIAGASVWLATFRYDAFGGGVATTTLSDGSFALRDVNGTRSLGAIAAGYGPSALVDLDVVPRVDGRAKVRLVLGAEGGSLSGRVLSPAGEPVIGARVAVGNASLIDRESRSDDTYVETWTPRITSTDERGEFAFTGLAQGVQPVVVRTTEFPDWRGEVDVRADHHLDIQLESSTSVSGTVLDEAGEPVENAMVILLDGPFVDRFPTQGPTDHGQPFQRPGARTDADGAYRLERLPAGTVHLYASKGTTSWYEDEPFLGVAQTEMSLAAGETGTWDPVLSKGPVIRGLVTHSDGSPMPNKFVHAKNETTSVLTSGMTDEEGRFEILGVERAAHRVRVQLWRVPPHARALHKEGVWPGAGEVVFVANFLPVAEEEYVEVTMRVVDYGKRVSAEAAVVMEAEDQQSWRTAHLEDGLHTAWVVPGRYRPLIYSGEDLVGVSNSFEVTAGENLDLGTFVTGTGGTILVHVTPGPDAPVTSTSVEIQHVGVSGLRPRTETVTGSKGTARFENVGPGELAILVSGTGLAVAREVRTILPGTEVELHIATRAGRRQTIELMFPEVGWGRMTMNLFDEGGALVHDAEWRECDASALPPLGRRPMLHVGRFRVEARTHSGLSVDEWFVIESVDEPDVSKVFELR